MFVSECRVRVRYGETDQMGYAYYGNYALYYEVARVEALRQIGTSYKELEEQGIMLPVLEVHSKYIKPARYDDNLLIKTYLRELPKARISFDFEIFNEEEDLLHKATVTLVFVDMKSNRPCRAPQAMLDKLQPYFDA